MSDIWYADGIFFGSYHHFCTGSFSSIDKVDDLLLSIAVVVGEVVFGDKFCTELFEEVFKTFRAGDSGECGDLFTVEERKFLFFSVGKKFDQMLGFVTAFDDFSSAGVAAEKPFQMGVFVSSVRLGEKNVVGTADIFDRFPQDAPRQDMAIAERIGRIDQHDIDVRLEHQILEAVIEDYHIALEVVNGVNAGFHPVFVHDHRHIVQVGSQHIRFITGIFGIQQQIFAVGHDFRRGFDLPVPENMGKFLSESAFFAPVTAA